MKMTTWATTALSAAALVLVSLVALVAPANAASSALKITGVEINCECGGAPDSGSGAYLMWGYGASEVAFTDPTPAKGHSYKLLISPKVATPKKGFNLSFYGKKGVFFLYQDQAKLKLGTKYTFTVEEVAGGKVVGKSAPVSWTPKSTGAPKEAHLDSQTMPNGVEAFVAGTSYHLTWSGAWQSGAKVHMQALVFDQTGTSVKALVGKDTFTGGAVVSSTKVSFTPTAAMVGDWIGISVYGQKAGEAPWGWTFQWIPVVASADSTAQWFLGSDKTGWASVDIPNDVVDGTVLTAKTDIPADSAGLGITATYQWYRETHDEDWNLTDTDIPGATDISYTATADDQDADLYVRVTYTSTDATYAPSSENVYAGSVEGPDDN